MSKSFIFVFAAFLIYFSSCTPVKNSVYFNNIGDTTIQSSTPYIEPVIQKGDLLGITVTSPNPEASLIFNAPNQAGPSIAASSGGGSGYLVNNEGIIQYPFLGNIKAAGLKKSQLQEAISSQLVSRKLLIDPIVSIRFLSFKVTIMGEVAHPSVIPVANEKINIMEALGMAGDLTPFANMNNVLLVREEEGVKTTHRLNLATPALLNSPYYYLKSNDIVYVEPTKEKGKLNNNRTQIASLVISGLSVAILIIDRLIK
jgi:polysaccharide biosynthesis/export protein